MPLSFDGAVLELVSLVALVFSLVLSAVVLSRYSRLEDPVGLLRERFVYGIPWGTAIVIALVYTVYYLVQGGGEDGGPIMTAFRSWSLWYPQGALFSSFAHASHSHLQGNVLGAIVFAPIVEYVWGHYRFEQENSSEQHSDNETNSVRNRLVATPPGRIAVFVAAVVVVGLLGSLLVPGAVIGFSGLVFAFAGFALVVKPLVTIVAILGLQVLRLLVRAFESPIVTATAEPRFVTPSWADVALQGHLFGVLIGAVLAVGLLRLRNQQPEIVYVWYAALVFAVTRSMEAVYWYLGTDQYILFRAVGTAGIILLAVVIAVAAAGPRPGDNTPRWQRLPALRSVAIGLLTVSLVVLSIGGFAYSIAPVSPGEEIEAASENQLEVGDYTITYAEGVEDQYIGAVSVPPLWEPSVTVSGVIITSDERNVWERAVSANELAFDGRVTIPVGDATWRELVHIDRTAWSFTEGNSTAKVFGTVSDESWTLLYRDSPAKSDVTVNNANLSIEPVDEFYNLTVERDDQVIDSKRLPTANETFTIDGVEYERVNDDLMVRHEGTEFTVAQFQTREQ